METVVTTLPASMKVVVCPRYGSAGLLRIAEAKTRVPRPNEIAVQIMATAVNSGDVRVRGLIVDGWLKPIMQLVLGFGAPRKPVLGTVFAGIVVQTGSKVNLFKTGDAVFGSTGFGFGCHAQYLTINQNSTVLPMPAGASFEQAAALPFGGQTAIYFLQKAGIEQRPNCKVLIIGGTGAVGTAAIQLAKHYGATVTAVCSTAGKALAERLGADCTILYNCQDPLAGPQRYAVIFDAVGKTSYRQCRHLLQQNGAYKSVGGLEYATETRAQLAHLKTLFESGVYEAVIDKTFNLHEAAAAHAYVEEGHKKGNVILKPFGTA